MSHGTPAKKTCFVVQGFGKKTDHQTGRTLDLDASYDVIKEAVENAGLECIRADEIQHSGIIDGPMYERILGADLVIADLSTSNVNAFYELGVRHALRPRATMIVAEQQFDFAFDINRNAIRTYEHLGPDLGRMEAKRFSQELTTAIKEIVEREDAVDSPLYTFFPGLQPPFVSPSAPEPRAAKQDAVTDSFAVEEAVDGQSLKLLTDQARALIARDQFVAAKTILEAAHAIRPNEANLVQQLALATYKSKMPSEEVALEQALEMVRTSLSPERSNDPETLGLWAAIHKRLWTIREEPEHLEESLEALERGFYVKNDYYNGINLAYMLNVRASVSEGPEAIADYVRAGRIRRKVVEICQDLLEAGVEDEDERYWVLATLWEAAVGLGDDEMAGEWKATAAEQASAGWMTESTEAQTERLRALLYPSPLEGIG